MSDRDFTQALREADEAYANRSLSPDAEQRIRARLDAARERRQRWSPALTLGPALATACAALVIYGVVRPNPARAPEPVKGFVAEAGGGEQYLVEARGDHVVATAPARVFDAISRIHVKAEAGAAFAHHPRGLRVLSGKVELAVEKRAAGEAPVAVLVSDGAIEILGTRFTVVQDERGGAVTLHEGRIQFRATDGRVVVLAPGETLRWPLEPPRAQQSASAQGPTPEAALAQAPAPSPSQPQAPAPKPSSRTVAGTTNAPKLPSPPAQVPPAAPPFDVEAFIEEINVLRRRGQFAEAAARLDAALQQPLPGATSERLGYELGSILTWQLKDADRACSVWSNLLSKHPDGRYTTEVQRARQSLGCP